MDLFEIVPGVIPQKKAAIDLDGYYSEVTKRVQKQAFF